jgi:DNA replication factor CDT1 like.
MRQTILPDHFLHSKQDSDHHSYKRKLKDLDSCAKSIKPPSNLLEKPKLNIPPSKVNELSVETLSILNTLNLSQCNKPAINPVDVLSTVTAREKFGDLLDFSRKLQLPYKYKRLLKLQEYIDTILNNARIRKIPTEYENIKTALENTYNVSFELESLQKILFLCPGLYFLHWEVENAEEKLFIDFPEKSNYCLSMIHNRNSMLNKELLNLTKKYHSYHLGNTKNDYNPESTKT